MQPSNARPGAAILLSGWLAAISPLPATEALDDASTTPTEAAESADDGAPHAPLSEFYQQLVVTATHPDLPSEALYSGREIEQQGGEDLGYFLRRQNGLSSFRRGPIGLDPQVRGLQAEQLGVFVDGTRTFAAGPGRMDSELAHVSPRAVGTLRVIKGPYALTWGAGALSAIQLETFRPAFGSGSLRPHGRAGFAYGANASATDAYTGVWGGGERLRFQALAQSREGDDYRDGGGATIPGDYRSLDGRWSFGVNLGEGAVLDYIGGYQHQTDIEYPGRQLDADYFYTRSHALELSLTTSRNGLRSIQALVYSNHKDHLMNNDQKPTALADPNRKPPFAIDVVLPTESNTAGGKLSLAGGSGALSWTGGVDLYQLRQTATRFISRRDTGTLLFRDIAWPEAEIDNLGSYFQLARREPAYTFAATLRADFLDAAAGEVSEFFRANTRGALEQSEKNLSFALSGRLRLAGGWTAHGGIGRAVRSASALERYSDRFPSTRYQVTAEFLGDPEIGPESSLQLDLGAEYRSARMLFEVEAFHRTLDDYITVLPDPGLPKRLPSGAPVVYRYVNGDEARFRGGELRVEQRASERLEWRAALSYVRGEDRTFDEPVFGLPPLTARLGLKLSPSDRLWLDLAATIADDQSRVATTRRELPTPGYAVVDLRGSWETAGGWRLTGGIDNAGDRLYSHHLNSLNPFTGQRIPEQGLNLHLGAEYSF